MAREKLRTFLERISYVDIISDFSNCIDALPVITEKKPDIIFLDIEMEHITGIQLLEKIPVLSQVVIISAYEKYALKGFELNVSDYILKPYSFDRLLKAVEKVRNILIKDAENEVLPQRDYIFIKTDTRILKTNLSDITYVEGMGDYLCVHTTTGKILTLITFSQLQEMLPGSRFQRVHKSFMVNLEHITSVENHRILIGDTRIPVSLTYRTDFYKSLQM